MDILARVKRCALLNRVRFTHKADNERIADHLTELEVLESLVNATRIDKTVRSTRASPRREYLHIIKGADGPWRVNIYQRAPGK